MEYRRLGASDLKVSPVTLGTWAIGGWLWGGTDEAKAVEAIVESVERGERHPPACRGGPQQDTSDPADNLPGCPPPGTLA